MAPLSSMLLIRYDYYLIIAIGAIVAIVAIDATVTIGTTVGIFIS